MVGLGNHAAQVLEDFKSIDGFPELSATHIEDEEIFSLDETTVLRRALARIVGRLSTSEDFAEAKLLENVRILVSDSRQSPAQVLEYGRDQNQQKPIIVVSRHLLSAVRSEDELAFVLFHEVAHPKFRSIFGFGATLAPEEMNADGYAIKWMVQCGYNWREAETCLRRFMSGPEDEVEERAKTFRDPHLHTADRIKTIHTGVGAWLIKNPGKTVPEPLPTLLDPEINRCAEELQREGFMQRLARTLNYAAMTASEKLQFLTEALPLLDLNKGYRVFETRKRQFVELLREVPKGLNDLQLNEQAHFLLDQAYAKAQYLDDKGQRCLGSTGFLSEMLAPLHEIITGNPPRRDYNKRIEKNALIPLGRLRELDCCAKTFVEASCSAQAFSAAQALIQAHQEAVFMLSSVYPSISEFRFNNFPAPQRDAPPPWKEHAGWAVADQSRTVLQALRILDTVSDPDLWRALPLTELQHDGFLGNRNSLNTNAWRSHSDRGLQEYFNGYVRERVRVEASDVPIEDISTRLDDYVYKYEPLLRPPNDAVFPDFNPYTKAGLDLGWGGGEKEAKALHYEASSKLVAQFEKILRAEDPGARELVRSFFLNRYDKPGFINLMSLPVRPPTRDGHTRASYSLDSPFVQFILQDDFKLFSIGEKVGLVDACRPKDSPTLNWWRDKLGHIPPENIEQMTKFLSEFKSPVYGLLGRAFCAQELSDFFDRIGLDNIEPYSAEMARLCLQISAVDAVSGISGPEPKALRDRLAERFLSVKIPKDQEFAVCPDMPLDEVLSFFHFVDYYGFIPGPEVRAAFGARIIAELSILTDTDRKIKCIYEVLSDSSAARDVHLRRYCIDAWVEIQAARLGQDDGTEDYRKRFDAVLDEPQGYFGQRTIYDMAMKLSDAIVAQRELSVHVREKINQRLQRNFYSLHGEIKGAYTLVEFLRSDKEGRLCLLEFLTSPLNSQSVDRLAEAINNSGYAAKLHRYAIKASIPERFYEDLGVYPDDGSGARQRALRMALWDVHANFWEQPPEARTLILDTVLLPPGEFVKDKHQAYIEASDVVLDGLFKVFKQNDLRFALKHPVVSHIINQIPGLSRRPYRGESDPLDEPVIQRAIFAVHEAFAKPPPNDELERRNAWGRLFATSYLEDCHDAERPLLLAAVMAAAEQTGQNPEKNAFGERLAALLGWLGPAYRKLGQALHSSSATPEDVRKPCGELKSRAQNITRPQLFDLIEQDVPAEVRERITWVGPVVGNASFFVTAKVRYRCDDGVERDRMLSLLAPNAAEDAEKGFTRLERTAVKLRQFEPAFEPIADVVLEMVRQARELSKVETDLHLGFKQAEIARQQYAGMTVYVDGRPFNFSAAKWTTYGQRFRITECVDGDHFNDLPEITLEQRRYKHDLAAATATIELLNIMRGREFDIDRHGAQCRAVGTECGVFDHGGLSLTVPSDGEKKQLAQVIWKTFQQHKQQDAGSVLFNEVARIQEETGQRADYLMRAQKAFLALNDFLQYLAPNDFSAVAKAVMTNPEVDAIFVAEFRKKLLLSGKIFGVLAASNGPKIRVERRGDFEEIAIK